MRVCVCVFRVSYTDTKQAIGTQGSLSRANASLSRQLDEARAASAQLERAIKIKDLMASASKNPVSRNSDRVEQPAAGDARSTDPDTAATLAAYVCVRLCDWVGCAACTQLTRLPGCLPACCPGVECRFHPHCLSLQSGGWSDQPTNQPTNRPLILCVHGDKVFW